MRIPLTIQLLAATVLASAAEPSGPAARQPARILFLHHSTGSCVWKGGVADWFAAYNQKNATDYRITEQAFPKSKPYGWENYPFDYWNIWVKNAGDTPFKDEPTLEILSKQYDLIIFKHCFPVSSIHAGSGKPDVASSDKTLENYKLQYTALKAKMRTFPAVKFIVWTPAALVASATNPDEAKRTAAFAEWMQSTWDEKGDNIFVWDFYGLETEGGNVLKAENAASPKDSHPSDAFAKKVAPLFAQRVVDVLEGRGDAAKAR